MRFKSEIRAIFILLWMIIRYIFVCLFWPLLQKKKNEGLKLYSNGDIVSPSLIKGQEKKKIEAIITQDETIVFVGSLTQAQEYLKGQNGYQKVNLQGQTLSPGFIDPHLHPSMAALICSMDFITPFDWKFPWGQFKG